MGMLVGHRYAKRKIGIGRSLITAIGNLNQSAGFLRGLLEPIRRRMCLDVVEVVFF